MHRRSNATPLLALDAVVLDIEATGLDPAKARIVEIAALRLAGGSVSAETFSRRINPGEPIPIAATKIHGIDDAAVASEPSFENIWPDLVHFIGHSVVIGHSLGYDLALLKRECERAGLPWK